MHAHPPPAPDWTLGDDGHWKPPSFPVALGAGAPGPVGDAPGDWAVAVPGLDRPTHRPPKIWVRVLAWSCLTIVASLAVATAVVTLAP